MAKDGARECCVPTHPERHRRGPQPRTGPAPDWCTNQIRTSTPTSAWGATAPPRACLYTASSPRSGESIAWAESSAVVFTTPCSARTTAKRPSALAADCCGQQPRYGLHLDENRKGQLVFKGGKLKDLTDYGSLGALRGPQGGRKHPGVRRPQEPYVEDLVYLGAARPPFVGECFSTRGRPPEPPPWAAALGGIQGWVSVVITDGRSPKVRRQLTSGQRHRGGYVAVGCPHYSCADREVARTAPGQEGVTRTCVLDPHQRGHQGPVRAAGLRQDSSRTPARADQDLCTVLEHIRIAGFMTLAPTPQDALLPLEETSFRPVRRLRKCA
jgi:predicted aconitase